jgi:hypothetical protein
VVAGFEEKEELIRIGKAWTTTTAFWTKGKPKHLISHIINAYLEKG